MELFIEKEFLEDFEIDFDNNPIKKIVKNIITSYGDKRVFVNYDENEFVTLKVEYEFFALICSTSSPIPVEKIEEEVRKSNFSQTLVFSRNEESWHKEIEEKGGWCFSFENYQSKIESIIETLHFKVDLSTKFNGWDLLDFSEVPFNNLQITDGYILKDEKTIQQNLFPLIEVLINQKKDKVAIDILVKEVGFKTATEEKKKEFAKKQYQKLNSKFTSLIKLKIYLSNLLNEIDLHDRTVFTNFSILESGVGFSVINKKISNSQMLSTSIFEKYTYDRLKRLKSYQQKYIDKLNSNGFQSTKFYKYP